MSAAKTPKPRTSPRGVDVKVGDIYAARVGTRIAQVRVMGSTIEHRGGALLAPGDPRAKKIAVTIWHCETLDTKRMVRVTTRRLRLI